MSIYSPQSNEVEFFNENQTVVTNARFIVENQTYAMNGVTSVKQGVKPANRTAGIIMAIIGLILLLSLTGGNKIWGIILLGIGIWIAYSAKPTGLVLLQSSSGEVQALSSQNLNYISAVVSALNQSIIHRG